MPIKMPIKCLLNVITVGKTNRGLGGGVLGGEN